MEMKMQTEPNVLTCLAEQCSWNCEDQCCAPAITVGDEHPQCDMFTREPRTPLESMAIVSDCHVQDCHFNRDMKCGAAGITLGIHSEHADCITYRE